MANTTGHHSVDGDHATALYRLIYASISESLSKQDIEDILDTSESWNAAHEITGALIFTSRFFMQILEGPRSEVEFIFAKIREDERHRSVKTIAAHATDERLFGDWSMRYFGERQLPGELMKEISPGAVFRPHDLPEEASLKLLRHLAIA